MNWDGLLAGRMRLHGESPNTLAYCIGAVLIILAILMVERRSWMRRAAMSITALAGGVMILTQSRSGALSLILCALPTLLIYRTKQPTPRAPILIFFIVITLQVFLCGGNRRLGATALSGGGNVRLTALSAAMCEYAEDNAESQFPRQRFFDRAALKYGVNLSEEQLSLWNRPLSSLILLAEFYQPRFLGFCFFVVILSLAFLHFRNIFFSLWWHFRPLNKNIKSPNQSGEKPGGSLALGRGFITKFIIVSQAEGAHCLVAFLLNDVHQDVIGRGAFAVMMPILIAGYFVTAFRKPVLVLLTTVIASSTYLLLLLFSLAYAKHRIDARGGGWTTESAASAHGYALWVSTPTETCHGTIVFMVPEDDRGDYFQALRALYEMPGVGWRVILCKAKSYALYLDRFDSDERTIMVMADMSIANEALVHGVGKLILVNPNFPDALGVSSLSKSDVYVVFTGSAELLEQEIMGFSLARDSERLGQNRVIKIRLSSQADWKSLFRRLTGNN